MLFIIFRYSLAQLGGQLTAPTSQRSFTCSSLSMFLGIDNESSHVTVNDPDPYSLNISDVAGSVVDAETTCWLLEVCWATDRGIMVVV